MLRKIALAALMAFSVPCAFAQATTGLWYASSPGDYVGGGATELDAPPEWTVSASSWGSNKILVDMHGPQSKGRQLIVAPGSHGTWGTGPYEMAWHGVFSGTAPGVSLSVDSRSCNTDTPLGRFVVLDYEAGSGGAIDRLAVNFEQHCGEAAPPLYGELRINSAVPFTYLKPAGSTTPDPFAFADRVAVDAGGTQISDSTTVYGINAPATISIAGGEYSINGGPYTSAGGTVVNRDRVTVRVTASATAGASSIATLNIDGVIGTFTVRTYEPGAPLSALWFQSSSGEPIGGGATLLALPPAWIVGAMLLDPPQIRATVEGPGPHEWDLSLAARPGQPFTLGAYEYASRVPFQGVSNGIAFTGDGGGCNTDQGRFSILDFAMSGTTITRLAVNFEQRCSASAPPLYGELRFNSGVPFTFRKPAGSATPDPFNLEASQAVVAPNAIVVSRPVSVYGINAPAAISIVGGTYSVNGSPFTAEAGTVNNRDQVAVRFTASATPGASTNATLTVGGVSSTVSVQSYQSGMVMSGWHYRSEPGSQIDAGITRTTLSPPAIITSSGNANVVSMDFNGELGAYWSIFAAAPTGTALSPGIYEGAHRGSGPDFPALDVSGNGSGCNTLNGRFVIHELVRNPDGSIQKIAMDLEQRCNGATGSLFGEIRINSAVPLSIFVVAAPASVARFDTNGDGKSDVVFRKGDGSDYVWQIDGATISGGSLSIASQGALPSVDSSWIIAGIGDFNGDGKADILWRDSSGTNFVWHLDGAVISGGSLTIVSQGLLPSVDTSWTVAGIGDFNGDGKSDILWRKSDGTNYVWHVDGANISGGIVSISSQGLLPGVPPDWSVAGIGDFNGDGKSDIYWRHGDGTNYIWHVDGSNISGGMLSIASQGLLPGVDSSWSVAGTGDYNGDGKSDIFFRKADGTNYVWHVNGAVITGGMLQIVSQGLLPSVDSSWSCVGQGDYNGDRKSDVFWRKSDGTNYVWHVDGATINGGILSIPSQGLLPGVDTSWTVQNPR